MERKKDFQEQLLNQPILSLSLLKSTLFMESIMNLKSSSQKFKESFRFLTGEILPLLSFINWRMWALLSRENSAEFSSAPKTILKQKMLGKESRQNFHMRLEDSTTEMRSEIFLHLKHTETITIMKYNSQCNLVLHYLEDGSQTSKSDTTSIPKDFWSMMETTLN